MVRNVEMTIFDLNYFCHIVFVASKENIEYDWPY